jgi:N-acetylmuramoyl-L-alanine amidase
MPKIYLSPSFQDHNVGVGDFGTEERRCNEIADVVERELKKSDKFVVIRNKPEMSLLEVIRDSNKNNPDIHFSIHTNAGADTARGCEVYAYKPNTNGDKLAQIVYRRLSAITPPEDRGVKYNSLAETTQTKAIAVLTEVSFHSNKEDAEWIINNIEKIGKELAMSLYEYYGIEYNENQNPTVKDNLTVGYSYADFVGDVQKCIGAKVDRIAGKETLSKTPTISARKNNRHAVVKPIQKYLYTLGYTEVGQADGIAGAKFDSATKHFQRDNGCVQDGEFTARNKTWKKILKLA